MPAAGTTFQATLPFSSVFSFYLGAQNLESPGHRPWLGWLCASVTILSGMQDLCRMLSEQWITLRNKKVGRGDTLRNTYCRVTSQ